MCSSSVPSGSGASSGAESDALVAPVLGANPFVGLTLGQVANAGGRWAGAVVRRPSVLLGSLLNWAAQEVRVLSGVSNVTPEPKDRRFADPAWNHPLWWRVVQTYLVTRDSVLSSVDQLGLDRKSADRARFALMQLTEATAPSNNLFTNPVALGTALDTRGRSLYHGARLYLHDLRFNGGMPSQVDTRPFRVGDTVANTPGAVVYRTPMFELIQYRPTTPKVLARPTMIIPPQVNRFYFLDLAPGRSFIEYALGRGIQMFLISWRNPRPRHSAWGLDDYAASCLEAMRVTTEISKSENVNIAGFCAGGMTTSAVLSHLADTDEALVNAATLAVTMIDSQVHSTLNMFASERTLHSSVDRSRQKGVLDGETLAKVFAFVRPNDLVWNYVVSNYLLGKNPPAFDVLAWNKDTTNLPAALHEAFMNLWIDNALVNPGTLKVLGTPVDLNKVRTDLYVAGALTDHLVPWEAAYAAKHAFGGNVRFVLSNSGHVQALINPPGNPKSNYYLNHADAEDAGDWLRGATRHTGTWWKDWADWTIEHSGEARAKPRSLGNRRHRILAEAPGRYVRE
jgi:polyhydroxyalkanoate synthase